MNNKWPVIKLLFLLLFPLTVIYSYGQKQFVITSSRENNYCNGTCSLLNTAELNGNPNAVIFITAIETKGTILDKHPICAYYNGKQWSVMNVDNSTMPEGAQFSVQYYTQADDNHFVHVVTKENSDKDGSYIDHPGLNGNPNAKLQFFQNASPNIRGGLVNPNAVTVVYDDAAGKWRITDSKTKTLAMATGYNISMSSDVGIITTPVPTVITTVSTVSVPSNLRPMTDAGGHVFVRITGSQQGQFTGTYENNRIEVTGFEMEVNSPRNANSGQSTGRRQYAFSFQKAPDAASLQFLKATISNERLTTVTFDIYKRTSNGASTIDYSIVLGGAVVSNFKQSYDEAAKGDKTDSISIVFQSITYVRDGVSVADSWNLNE